MAPLQKRALYTLVVGLVFTIAVIAVFILCGDVSAFEREEYIRWVTYAAMVGVPLTYLILINLTLRKPTQLDERDRLIIERSGNVQWLAIVFSLVAWTIALTEIFHEPGQVPVIYISLIMISTLIVSILAKSIGILLGYWRMNRNG